MTRILILVASGSAVIAVAVLLADPAIQGREPPKPASRSNSAD